MGKNGDRTRRSSAAELLETPPLTPPSATDSPKSAIFSRKINGNVSKFSSPENTNTAKNRVAAGLFKSSSRNISSLSTISDLKDLASSQLHDLKRLFDHSHSQIDEDLESSNSRLEKRFKIQSQACQKMMDEAEKEYKKMSQRIYESQEAMKLHMKSFWHMNRIVHIGFAKHPELKSRSPLRDQLMLFAAVLGSRLPNHYQLTAALW